MTSIPVEYVFQGNDRYIPSNFVSWIPWRVFDRIRVGYTVPVIGTNPFRTHYNVAWHMKPESQNVHSKKYRLKRAICEGDIREVSLTLKTSNIDKPVDLDGNLTPIMLASKFNQVHILKYFILKGAAIEVKDTEGATALMHAVNNMSFEAVKILVENGANMHEEDKHGISPFKKTQLKNFYFMQLFMKEAQGKHLRPDFPKFQLNLDFTKTLNLAVDAVSKIQSVHYTEPIAYPFNNLKEIYLLSLINKQPTI